MPRESRRSRVSVEDSSVELIVPQGPSIEKNDRAKLERGITVGTQGMSALADRRSCPDSGIDALGHRTNPLARESASRGVERVGRIAVAN
jgi:hypothetical protein